MKIRMLIIIILCFLSGMIKGQEEKSMASVDCADELKIYKFKLDSRSSGRAISLPWKIVVGRDIEYRAKPGSGNNWGWALGDGSCSTFLDFWKISTTPNGSVFKDKSKNDENEAITFEMPQSNNDFGSTHGQVQVSNGLEISCIDNNDNPAVVEVFFEKETRDNPSGDVPNWFYYWKQLLTPLTIEMPVYNPETPDSPNSIIVPIDVKYSDSGVFAWNPVGGMKLGEASQQINGHLVTAFPGTPESFGYATNYSLSITLGEGTSKLCAHEYLILNDENGNVKGINAASGTGSTGIDCFHQVYKHEYCHIEIYKQNWPNGYRTGQDADGDGYSDAFEMVTIGFNPNVSTPYSLGPGTVGWEYEEQVCREIEDNTPVGTLWNMDWSFDPTNEYQGKQWKK